jgi:hypothetical protein
MGSLQKQQSSFKRTKKSPVVSVASERKAPEPPIPAPPETTQALDEDKQGRAHTIYTIASQLQEKESSVRAQIAMIVKRLGITEATAICEEAMFVEAQGGMMLPDGSRRRTVGGIFFFLVRKKHPDLFNWRPKARKEGETGSIPPKAPSAPLPPLKWEERIIVLAEIGQEKGTTSVKITLIGKPGKIISRGTCVITSMQAKQAPASRKAYPRHRPIKPLILSTSR